MLRLTCGTMENIVCEKVEHPPCEDGVEGAVIP